MPETPPAQTNTVSSAPFSGDPQIETPYLDTKKVREAQTPRTKEHRANHHESTMNSSTNTLPFTSQVQPCAKEHELGAWRSAGPSQAAPRTLATLTSDALIAQASLVHAAQVILCEHVVPDGVSRMETIQRLLDLLGGTAADAAAVKVNKLLSFQS